MGPLGRLSWPSVGCLVAAIDVGTAMVFTPIATAVMQPPTRLGLEFAMVPTTTPAPTCHPRNRAHLKLRQNSVATCGYLGGNSASAVTCGLGLYCATTSTYVGCCQSTNCVGIFTTCYDQLGATCDQACQNVPGNLVCSSLPYCAQFRYEGGSTGYGCGLVSGFTGTVLLTATGASNLDGLPTSNDLYTTSTSSSTPPPTPAPSSSGLSGTSSDLPISSTSSSTSPTPPPPSGLGAGAIAGIAVGGAVAAAVIVGLIWFLWWKKRKTSITGPGQSPPAQHPYTPATSTHPTGRSAVVSELYDTGTYVFPSPGSDPRKQSWYTNSDLGAPYSSNATTVPSAWSSHGTGDYPVEMPAPHSYGYGGPTEVEGSRPGGFQRS